MRSAWRIRKFAELLPCTIPFMAPTENLHCSRCHSQFPAQTQPAILCPVCADLAAHEAAPEATRPTSIEAARMERLQRLPGSTRTGGIITPQ